MHVLPQYIAISLKITTVFNSCLYNLFPTVHILHDDHSINVYWTDSNVNGIDMGESNGNILKKLTNKQF